MTLTHSDAHPRYSNDPVIAWLEKNLTSDDAALIKGSHGLRMDRIVTALEVRS